MKRTQLLLALLATLLSTGAFVGDTLAHKCKPCPTDVPPINVPWNSGTYTATLIFNGQPCVVTICYCYRSTGPNNHDYYIAGVTSASGCGGSEPIEDLVRQAMDTIFNANPASFPCPPCPTTTMYWQEVQASCWGKEVDPISGEIFWYPCDSRGYCFTSYRVCCDPETGVRQNTLAWRSFSNYTCETGCNPICEE